MNKLINPETKNHELNQPKFGFIRLFPDRLYLAFLAYRLVQAIWFSSNMVHPDEYWQSTEVAYHLVFGGVTLPWEWHPDA